MESIDVWMLFFYFFEWAWVCDGYLVMGVKLNSTAFALLKPIIKGLSSAWSVLEILYTGVNFECMNICLCFKEGNNWACQYAFGLHNKISMNSKHSIMCQKTNGTLIVFSPAWFTQIQYELKKSINCINFFMERRTKWFPELLNMNKPWILPMSYTTLPKATQLYTACSGHHNLNCTVISMRKKQKNPTHFLNPFYKDSALPQIDTWGVLENYCSW